MFGKGDCRFLGNVKWDGFRWRDCEDGWGQGAGAPRCRWGGNTAEMEVPKRWFLRKSEGPGPRAVLIAESRSLGSWRDSCMPTVCFQGAGGH